MEVFKALSWASKKHRQSDPLPGRSVQALPGRLRPARAPAAVAGPVVGRAPGGRGPGEGGETWP